MESIAPPLVLLSSVKRSIEKGSSIKGGVLSYIERNEGEFVIFVTRWLAQLQQGHSPQDLVCQCESPYRRVLMQVLERGLRGEPVYQVLLSLEEEIIEACNEEIGNKIARLPFLMLIPLLCFQFPAFLLLLFGPLLKNFFHSLGGG